MVICQYRKSYKPLWGKKSSPIFAHFTKQLRDFRVFWTIQWSKICIKHTNLLVKTVINAYMYKIHSKMSCFHIKKICQEAVESLQI